MNIVTIINKLKEANMITTTEDGMKLFADCFNKFGISLLLLRDENKFSEIVEILKENEIPIQKENGVYVLRIFAVDVEEIKNIISEFKACNELQFLRKYPEMIAEPKNIQIISKNIVKFQNEGKIL